MPRKKGDSGKWEYPAVTHVGERFNGSEGTRGLSLKPDYVPDGIEVAFATAPVRDDGMDIEHRLAHGWVFVTSDKVTDDLNKAKAEGLICFTGLRFGKIGNTPGVGLQNLGLVLMWRPEEVGRKVRGGLIDSYRKATEGVGDATLKKEREATGPYEELADIGNPEKDD